MFHLNSWYNIYKQNVERLKEVNTCMLLCSTLYIILPIKNAKNTKRLKSCWLSIHLIIQYFNVICYLGLIFRSFQIKKEDLIG